MIDIQYISGLNKKTGRKEATTSNPPCKSHKSNLYEL